MTPDAAAADLIAFLAHGDAPLQAPRVLAKLKLCNDRVHGDMPVTGRGDTARAAPLQRFYIDSGIIRRATPLADLYTHELIG